MGKARKFTDEQVRELVAAYGEYIDSVDDPLIPEFLYSSKLAREYKTTKDDIDHYSEFGALTKILVYKQEVYNLRKGFSQPAMAIFRLKQPLFGYKDKVENDFTTDGEKISFLNTVPRNASKEPSRKKNNPIAD